MAEYKKDFDDDATPVNVPAHVSDLEQMFDAVQRMFAMPQFKDTKFQFRWNSVILTIDKDTTREDLKSQHAEQYAAYKETPEYKTRRAEQQARDASEVAAMQKKADALFNGLPKAIKKGEAAVVDWLDEMSGYLSHRGVDIDQEAAAYQLRQSGICPIEISDDDDTANADLVAQNLISGAVQSMEKHDGLFDNMVKAEADRYREIKKTGKDTLGMARKMDILSRPPRPRL